MADVLCPVCEMRSEPRLQIGDVLVCGACGTSLVSLLTGLRRATAQDLPDNLDDLKQLQRARAAIAQKHRR